MDIYYEKKLTEESLLGGVYLDGFIGFKDGSLHHKHLLGEKTRTCWVPRGHVARVGIIPVHAVVLKGAQTFPALCSHAGKSPAGCGGLNAGADCGGLNAAAVDLERRRSPRVEDVS